MIDLMKDKYLLLREQHIAKPFGKRRAVEVLSKFLISNMHRTPQKVFHGIELGCGKGQILRLLRKSIPLPSRKLQLYGIDRDELAVERANQLTPDMFFIVRDLNTSWDKGLKSFDFIIIVNVLHEIFSESIRKEGNELSSFAQAKASQELDTLLKKCYELLDPQGLLVIFDGVAQHDKSMINFTLSNAEDLKILSTFSSEFIFHHEPIFDISTDNTIRMTKADFLNFLTKYESFLNETWQIEKNEIYPFYCESKYMQTMHRVGFSVLQKELSISDIQLWRKLVTPVSDKSFDFPFQHILLIGEKNEYHR